MNSRKQHKPLTAHLLTLFGGVVVASSILFVSLLKTASLQASTTSQTSASDKRFYLDSEIKPDHVLYPVMGSLDKLKISMASPEKKAEHCLDTAQRKAGYAEYLLQEQNESLAVTTFVHGQRYLQLAADQAVALQDPVLARQVHDDLEDYYQKMSTAAGDVSPEKQTVLNQLLAENTAAQTAVEPLTQQIFQLQ